MASGWANPCNSRLQQDLIRVYFGRISRGKLAKDFYRGLIQIEQRNTQEREPSWHPDVREQTGQTRKPCEVRFAFLRMNTQIFIGNIAVDRNTLNFRPTDKKAARNI